MVDPEYRYDEAASAEWHMDVVNEVEPHDRVQHAASWVESMRRLNAIKDPLARRLIALHRDCNGGEGLCDSCEAGGARDSGVSWPCETLEAIAEHYGIELVGDPS